MDVAQFLHIRAVQMNVEIVIALLPEMIAASDQLSRDSLLECLECLRKVGTYRFAYEKMHVLGHHDVAINQQSVLPTASFECEFEDVFRVGGTQEWASKITAEGNEVNLTELLVALQSPGHEMSLRAESWSWSDFIEGRARIGKRPHSSQQRA